MIQDYEADLYEILRDPDRNIGAAISRARLPLSVRGFGPVKAAAAVEAERERDALMEAFRTGATVEPKAMAS